MGMNPFHIGRGKSARILCHEKEGGLTGRGTTSTPSQQNWGRSRIQYEGHDSLGGWHEGFIVRLEIVLCVVYVGGSSLHRVVGTRRLLWLTWLKAD